MYFPESAVSCIRALEQAGFEAYAVGGCVRDALLGLVPHDYDLCTSALPEEICQVFSGCRLIHNGERHGTIGVVICGEVIEITTFRTEGGYQDSRHPDWVRFVGNVEEDLARRDFTVNAMAYAPRTGLVDPWGGQTDLKNHILRTVGDPSTRFSEDALRLLRGVRFSIRFSLTPEPATLEAMFRLAPTMKHLAAERVFEELCKLLPLANVRHLLQFAPVLAAAVPEITPCIGFQQHNPHHAYDVFTHIAHTVEAVPAELPLRWAALLHDIGKPSCFTQDENGRGHFLNHAAVSGEMADAVLRRLKAPTALREQVVFLTAHHMILWERDKKILRRRLGKYGVENVLALIALQEADMGSKGTGVSSEKYSYRQVRELISQILEEDACLSVKDLAINGTDLMALGFTPGPILGKCLEQLLQMVQDETLTNERCALLSAAEAYHQEVIA